MKTLIIIRKELLDQIRDRRTIVAAILMPAVIVPMLLFLTSQRSPDNRSNNPARIIIDENETGLKLIIQGSLNNAMIINGSSSTGDIINGRADIKIESIKKGNIYESITIYYDSARITSSLAYTEIEAILKSQFSSRSGASDSTVIRSQAVRGDKENKTLLTLSLLLPVLFMVFAASSTMSGAIDMSSGEKERSTIEVLLSSNISHSAIILGKILASSITGLASILSLLAGLILSSHFYPQITGGIPLLKFCGAANLLLMTAITAIPVFLFSTAGMTIGLYARSVKEGTILTIPVIILISALSSGLVSGDPFTVQKFHLLIPVQNSAFLIRSLIFNHSDFSQIALSAAVNMAFALLLLIICRYLLKKESVIFRS